MASQAVNVNTVLNFIATKIGISIDIVRSWFPNEASNRNKLLNIGSVIKILSRMTDIGFGDSTPSTGSLSSSDKRACSYNTLEALYNRVMGTKIWNLITNIKDLKYGHFYSTLNGDVEISGSIKGGDGGGSGAVYGAATFDVTSGNGADGAPSLIIRRYRNGGIISDPHMVESSGGAGGVGKNVTGGKSPGASNGNSGEIASVNTYNIVFKLRSGLLAFLPGYGGGGSCGVRSPNTYVGPSATQASGSNASNAGESTNNNTQGGGGGGASGYYTDTLSLNLYRPFPTVSSSAGTDYTDGKTMNYPSAVGGSVIEAPIGASAKGGRGGDTEDTTGSLGGVYKSNSQRSGGGNGGNSGYITITAITQGFILNDTGIDGSKNL